MRKPPTYAQLQHHLDTGHKDPWERPIIVTDNVGPPVLITYQDAGGMPPQGTAVLRCAACQAVFDMRLRSKAERQVPDKGRRLLTAPIIAVSGLSVLLLLTLFIGPGTEWINGLGLPGWAIIILGFAVMIIGGGLLISGITLLVVATTVAFAHDRSECEIQLRPTHQPPAIRHVVKLSTQQANTGH